VKLKEAYEALFDQGPTAKKSPNSKKFPYRVCFDVPEAMYKKFKLLAVAKEKTIQKLALEAMSDKLAKEIDNQ